MRRRWSPHHWLLIAVVLVSATAGAEFMRKHMKPPPSPPALGPYEAEWFRLGYLTNFELPDARGKRYRFTDLESGPTVISFVCDCKRCIDVQRYLAGIAGRIGKK